MKKILIVALIAGIAGAFALIYVTDSIVKNTRLED
jgi:hypothetical protein